MHCNTHTRNTFSTFRTESSLFIDLFTNYSKQMSSSNVNRPRPNWWMSHILQWLQKHNTFTRFIHNFDAKPTALATKIRWTYFDFELCFCPWKQLISPFRLYLQTDFLVAPIFKRLTFKTKITTSLVQLILNQLELFIKMRLIFNNSKF